CVQFYAGNFLQDVVGKNGHIYAKRNGFCLETQVEPNAVNEPSFHSPVIEKDEVYHTVTAYRFYVK
ncbi:MAG: galactose-1-epimerase, partial [Blautia sp.]|nr:galactose-1-epimerase [Blautia sp.]